MRWGCLACALFLLGCGAEFDVQPTTVGGGSGGGANAGGHAGSPGATGGGNTSGGNDGGDPSVGGGGAAGGGSGVLVDRGLLARYFIDEATNGQQPTHLRDAASDPIDLPVTYTTSVGFTGQTPHRGLRFDATGGMGRASVLMDGTKLTALEGITQATLEVVATLDAADPLGSRLIHVGDLGNESRFSLQARSTTEVDFEWRGSTPDFGLWQVADLAQQRAVLHFVFDTPAANAQDRGRLYLDGVRQAATIAAPQPSEPLQVGTGRFLVVGNREAGERTPQGVIHYAAIYAAALTDAEIVTNAAALTAADDRP